MKILNHALKIWLIILPIAFINGILRVALINLIVGEKLGHIISILLLSVAAVLVIYFYLKNKKLENKELIVIGFLLVLFTVIFEFGLGLATGKTSKFMLADYNIFQGRIWPLVLLTEFLSPFVLKIINKK